MGMLRPQEPGPLPSGPRRAPAAMPLVPWRGLAALMAVGAGELGPEHSCRAAAPEAGITSGGPERAREHDGCREQGVGGEEGPGPIWEPWRASPVAS